MAKPTVGDRRESSEGIAPRGTPPTLPVSNSRHDGLRRRRNPPGPPTSRALDADLLPEDVAGRVHVETLHALVHEREQRAPDRLHDRTIVLQDRFELGRDL